MRRHIASYISVEKLSYLSLHRNSFFFFFNERYLVPQSIALLRKAKRSDLYVFRSLKILVAKSDSSIFLPEYLEAIAYLPSASTYIKI